MEVELRALCQARSGDKADRSDISLFAPNQALYEVLRREVTAERVREHFRGLVAGDAAGPEKVERDGEGRPRRMQQMGWQVQYLDRYPADAGRPALPRRIEASNGDAKVRLLVDQWGQGTP